jgi:site-specific DNA-cytosine methylase
VEIEFDLTSPTTATAFYDFRLNTTSPTFLKLSESAYNYRISKQSMAVRRLTPVECERLQGFPDNYTAIPWRGKEETPDGPRYKALGNSMAVPVMKWIGKQIEATQ